MHIALLYHSLISDWNHGNAHFLRGITSELLERGHQVKVYEPASAWSLQNLLREHGSAMLEGFHRAYPGLSCIRYDQNSSDIEGELDGAQLIIVHEWNDAGLIRRLGRYRRRRENCRLLYHDTHHRSITDPGRVAECGLSNYDGVLAYGSVIRDLYVRNGWAERAWTWHEAADIRIFRPYPEICRDKDVVWIGNWGDDERTSELRQFFIEPVRELALRAGTYGVRYPAGARKLLADSGIAYGGWLPNYAVPRIFAGYKATVHIPRRPYVEALPGIPTIRPFEALACGIPLLCSPWHDTEHLFTPGLDYLPVRDASDMKRWLKAVIQSESLRSELSEHGRRTVLERHTCGHRVNELLDICRTIGLPCDLPAGDLAELEN